MNKNNIICLNCGKVQVRTDLDVRTDANYVFLNGKHMCPNCSNFTSHIATRDVKLLRKRLTQNCEHIRDRRVLELIQR